MVYEQIESLWPVHGSILVRDGIAHFVAGRSIFVDGGMRLYRLDAKSGRVVSRTVLDERNPKTGRNVQELIKWLNMPVGRPDILSCDKERLYRLLTDVDLDPIANGPVLGRSAANVREVFVRVLGEQSHGAIGQGRYAEVPHCRELLLLSVVVEQL